MRRRILTLEGGFDLVHVAVQLIIPLLRLLPVFVLFAVVVDDVVDDAVVVVVAAYVAAVAAMLEFVTKIVVAKAPAEK